MNVKALIGFLILAALVTAGSLAGYRFFIAKSAAPKTSTTVPVANPFTQVPDTSFGNAQTATYQNPFAEPSPTTYQNPFTTTSSGDQAYTNPFEALR